MSAPAAAALLTSRPDFTRTLMRDEFAVDEVTTEVNILREELYDDDRDVPAGLVDELRAAAGLATRLDARRQRAHRGVVSVGSVDVVATTEEGT